jgi:preprotein translocase subunit SecD
MTKRGWLIGLLLGLTAASAAVIFQQDALFSLVMASQSGSQITFMVKPSETIKNLDSPEGRTAIAEVEQVLHRRIQSLGLPFSRIRRIGPDQIQVQLPGVKDLSEAETLLGRSTQLELREQLVGTEDQFIRLFQEYRPLLDEEARLLKEVNSVRKPEDRAKLASTQRVLKQMSQEKLSTLFKKTGITGQNLTDAYAEPIQHRAEAWQISIRFDSEGEKKFVEMTKNLAGTGRAIGVFLDGTLISSPMVGPEFSQSGIPGGGAVINGNFTAQMATELANQLKSGRLPVPIEVLR